MSEYIESEFNPCDVCNYKRCSNCVLHELAMKIIRHPAADVAPVRHGRWLEADDGDGIVCSVCGTDFCTLLNETEKFNGCPHCLARMKGE